MTARSYEGHFVLDVFAFTPAVAKMPSAPSYRLRAPSLERQVFIRAPHTSVDTYVRAAVTHFRAHAQPLASFPTLFRRMTHPTLGHHQGALLCPPIADTSLFCPELVVPFPYYEGSIGSLEKPRGYVVASDFVPGLKFYVSPFADRRLLDGRSLHASVRAMPGTGPRMELRVGNTRLHPETAAQNRDALAAAKDLANPWWRMDARVRDTLAASSECAYRFV